MSHLLPLLSIVRPLAICLQGSMGDIESMMRPGAELSKYKV
jgi:hypothetical protein